MLWVEREGKKDTKVCDRRMLGGALGIDRSINRSTGPPRRFREPRALLTCCLCVRFECVCSVDRKAPGIHASGLDLCAWRPRCCWPARNSLADCGRDGVCRKDRPAGGGPSAIVCLAYSTGGQGASNPSCSGPLSASAGRFLNGGECQTIQMHHQISGPLAQSPRSIPQSLRRAVVALCRPRRRFAPWSKQPPTTTRAQATRRPTDERLTDRDLSINRPQHRGSTKPCRWLPRRRRHRRPPPPPGRGRAVMRPGARHPACRRRPRGAWRRPRRSAGRAVGTTRTWTARTASSSSGAPAAAGVRKHVHMCVYVGGSYSCVRPSDGRD